MKAYFQSVAISLLLLLGLNASAQDCQTVLPNLLSTTPAFNPTDTSVQICLGETLFFEGAGLYPQNGNGYLQSDATSSFIWLMGNGDQVQGASGSYTYQEPGAYTVVLKIYDVEDCTNEMYFVLKVQVAGSPSVNLIPNLPPPFCPDLELDLYPIFTPEQYDYNTDIALPDIQPIPDGTGESIDIPLTIFGYGPDEVVENILDIQRVCATIEHSYLRDLEITLTCPDGTSIILHDFAGLTGGEVFMGEPFEMDEGQTPVPGVGYEYCWTPTSMTGTIINFINSNPVSTLPPGDYNAFQGFSDLIGCPLNGEWTLSFFDNWGVDNGVLFNWGIEFEDGSFLTGDSSLVSLIYELNQLPPVSFGIDSSAWVLDPTIQAVVEDTATVILPGPYDYQFLVYDSLGCEQQVSTPISNILVDDDSCLPCDSLVIDAGPDMEIGCISEINLGTLLNSQGEHIVYSWSTVDGNVLTDPTAQMVVVDNQGTYIFTLENLLTGCILMDEVIVTNSMGVFADAGEDIQLQCGENQVTITDAIAPAGPGYTINWVLDSGTGQILSGANTLNPVIQGSGVFSMTVEESSTGCIAIDYVEVNVDPDLALDFQITDANCDLGDGSATVTIPPNSPAVNISWSNGQTGATATGLSQGLYSVTVSSTDGSCVADSTIFVDETDDCKVIIRGTVFDDSENLDCILDVSTQPAFGVMLHLLPDDIYTFTNAIGEYEFLADPGSFTIEYIDGQTYDLLCPVDGMIVGDLPNAGMVSENNDYFVEQELLPNLCISVYDEAPRPGFDQAIQINVTNYGGFLANATLTFRHDSLLLPGNLDMIADTYDPVLRQATFLLEDIEPYETQTVAFALEVPVDLTFGTIVSYDALVEPVANDAYPDNNSLGWNRIVINSYDPNDKQSFTGLTHEGGPIYLPEDSVLHYQIRFQNTGNAEAINVLIRDTLDVEFLDVESLRFGSFSHDVALEFEGNNILIFRMDDIYLPDSTSNFEESQGYVNFSINTRSDLQLGDVIENRAAIYFDFNAPIITNKTIHIVSEPPVSTNTIGLPDEKWEIIPNPFSDQVRFVAPISITRESPIRILNVHGQVVFEQKKYRSGTTIDLIDLPSGIYFLEWSKQGQWISAGKMVK